MASPQDGPVDDDPALQAAMALASEGLVALLTAAGMCTAGRVASLDDLEVPELLGYVKELGAVDDADLVLYVADMEELISVASGIARKRARRFAWEPAERLAVRRARVQANDRAAVAAVGTVEAVIVRPLREARPLAPKGGRWPTRGARAHARAKGGRMAQAEAHAGTWRASPPPHPAHAPPQPS